MGSKSLPTNPKMIGGGTNTSARQRQLDQPASRSGESVFDPVAFRNQNWRGVRFRSFLIVSGRF
jgi:hypothetical protein